MSAFIVRNETINRILTGMARCDTAKAIMGEAGFDLTNPEMLAGLGHELLRLNIYGVDARYGEGRSTQFRDDLRFEYDPTTEVSDIQAFKSLGCLSYQCCEGDVPERPLYKLLNKVEAAWDKKLDISGKGQAEYNAAEWD